MKKTFFWILGVVAVATLVSIGWLVMSGSKLGPATPGGSTTFPSVGGGAVSEPLITIQGVGGEALQTKDFLTTGVAKEDKENPGYFYLDQMPGGDERFTIEYISSTHYFLVELLVEPLGQTRTDAENYLRQTLGLTKEQMCSLSYSVGVPNSVSSTYTGTNLGFSFCPGAVKLP